MSARALIIIIILIIMIRIIISLGISRSEHSSLLGLVMGSFIALCSDTSLGLGHTCGDAQILWLCARG